jgi:hypothetical protein
VGEIYVLVIDTAKGIVPQRAIWFYAANYFLLKEVTEQEESEETTSLLSKFSNMLISTKKDKKL